MKATTESKALQPTSPTSTAPSDYFREFDHALHAMERRMDRLLSDAFGSDLRFPVLQGLLLQPDADGRLTFKPFGHLQETLDKFAAGIREPALSWKLADDGKAIEFHAEVPGLKRGDLDVQVSPEALVIKGQAKNTRYEARCEPGIKLDPNGAEAHCEDGVLTVRCKAANAEGPRSRRLTVS